MRGKRKLPQMVPHQIVVTSVFKFFVPLGSTPSSHYPSVHPSGSSAIHSILIG